MAPKGASFKKRFENAIRKNKIIATIQQLGEEKDVAGDESQLEKAGLSIRSFREELVSSVILSTSRLTLKQAALNAPLIQGCLG